MNTYPMEPGALEGALLTVAATTPDTAAGIRAHIDSLTAELAQKDAQIKALAEALHAVREHGYAKRWIDNAVRDIRGEVAAALRLAEVLK